MILALIIKDWWQKTNELSASAELSWKQEIYVSRKSDRKGVLVQTSVELFISVWCVCWRRGGTVGVKGHQMRIGMISCPGKVVIVLETVCSPSSLVVVGVPRWGCYLFRFFFPSDKLNIRQYVCAQNQTHISGRKSRANGGNVSDLQLLFFIWLHEIFASQLTEQRISIFHFQRAIMKRRSYFTSLTSRERLKWILLLL